MLVLEMRGELEIGGKTLGAILSRAHQTRPVPGSTEPIAARAEEGGTTRPKA